MNIHCKKEHLKKYTALAEKVTGKNATLPILQSVLLAAKDNVLQIRATNLDVGVEFSIPARVDAPGRVAVSGSVLSGTLAHLSEEGDVTLRVENNNLAVQTKEKNKNIVIKSYPSDDFPTLPKIQSDTGFVVSAQKFVSGIKSVLFSASVSDIKPEISSVYIYPDGEELVFVATDSFRLAEKRITQKNIADFPGVIIPFKNLNEIIRIFENEGDVAAMFNKNQLSLYTDEVYFTTRIIDGIFPDYKQIIPKEYTTEVVMLKQDLVDVFKLTNIFSDKFNRINFQIHPEKKHMAISSRNENGEYKTDLEGTLTGEHLDISFNYRYILDSFQSISSDSVSLQFAGSQKPVTIKGVGDNSFFALIGPIHA